MKKKIAIILAIALSLSAMPLVSYGSEIQAQGSQIEYVLSTTGDLRDLTLPEYITDITYADNQLALVILPSEAYAEELDADLSGQGQEISIQQNYTYEATGYSDPYYEKQWGLRNASAEIDINFEPAETLIKSNKTQLKETIVAVIDTGFDHNHSDLSANVWINKKEIKGNGKDDDKNGYVDDAYGYDFAHDEPLANRPLSNEYIHGTHCAGVIGAVSDNGIGITGITGASGKVKMMNLRVLSGADGEGSTFDLIRAIKYAEASGASICNLSMGSYTNDSMLYSVMSKSKMLFVCAAGNGNGMGGGGYNLNYKPMYPGSYNLSNVICVGNMQPDGTIARTSNYSTRYVDLAAPGTKIYSTAPGNSYVYRDGTSMAAPFVTGAAALLHSYYYGISSSQIKDLLRSTTTTSTALSDKVETSGYLNLYNAIAARPMDYYSPDETAPELIAEIEPMENTYRQKITIKATDDSGELPKVKYARGDKPASYFKDGYGYTVKLDEEGNGFKTGGVPGPYTVYARDGSGNTSVVKVNCTSDAPNSIKLNYTKKTLRKGQYFYLKATLSKTGKNGRRLTYSSSNKNIATVTSKGKVVTKKKGTVYITVKTENLLTIKCKVVVK